MIRLVSFLSALVFLTQVSKAEEFSDSAEQPPPLQSQSSQAGAVQISVDLNRMIYQGSTFQCVLATLFNQLSYSTTDLRSAIDALPGETPQQRYDWLVEKIASKPSEFYKGSRPRYLRQAGALAADLPYILRDILIQAGMDSKIAKQMEFFRVGSQKFRSARELAQIVHAKLVKSLKAHVPVAASFTGFENKRFLIGHEVVVLGVHPQNADGSFSIDLFDNLNKKIMTQTLAPAKVTFSTERQIAKDGEEAPPARKATYAMVIRPDNPDVITIVSPDGSFRQVPNPQTIFLHDFFGKL